MLQFATVVIQGQPQEWWTATTYWLGHLNVTHLWWNLVFGAALFIALDDEKAPMVFLVGCVTGGLAYLALRTGTHYSLGASAGVWALGGMYLRKNWVSALIIVLMIATFWQDGVNHIGHMTGLITGLTYSLIRKEIYYEQIKKDERLQA
jgi:membrane associated rhomboid family serine protease